MQTQTVIFAGPPGSGKGTQAQRLAEYVSGQDPDKDLLHFDVGEAFRDLAGSAPEPSSRMIEDSMQSGDILPSFLSVHLWTEAFLENLDASTHLIVDGSPRRLREAKLLDEALSFYDRSQAVVIHLDIDEQETHERLSDRGREDDDRQTIQARLQAFREETRPVLAGWFQANDRYQYEQVEGDRDRQAIATDIQNLITN